MTFGSRKTSRKSLVRHVSVILSLCFFLGSLTACSGKSFKKKKIDVQEMARLVVDSLQDISETEALFLKIPNEQKDDMTYSEYYEYISVLQKMMPSGSRVVSFEIVEGEEKTELLESMLTDDSEAYTEMIRGCIPIRVETTGTRVSQTPLYFYIQTKPDGTVYLSRSWARSCMDLYSFSVHYFEAYSNENQTDVISLLPYTETAEPLPDSHDILREKADEMIRFYSHNVKSEYREYEMISIDASNLLYLQPKVLDSHLQTNPREVRFRSDENDVISVVDKIDTELKTADLSLYCNGRRTVRVGEHAAPSQLETLFGKPLTVTCGPVLEKSLTSDDFEDGFRNILIRYHGFTITVYGVFHSADDWDGTYTRFRIWDSGKAGIGPDLTVRNSSWDVLARYPFADEAGYKLGLSMDAEDYQLSINLDREHVNEDGSFPISTMVLERKRS